MTEWPKEPKTINDELAQSVKNMAKPEKYEQLFCEQVNVTKQYLNKKK